MFVANASPGRAIAKVEVWIEGNNVVLYCRHHTEGGMMGASRKRCVPRRATVELCVPAWRKAMRPFTANGLPKTQ